MTAHQAERTQACRDCGALFPYDEDADYCPACVEENTPTVLPSGAKPPVRATITRPGVPGRSEPHALLADGRTMPMGWSMGKTFSEGQQGEAQYVMVSGRGLWRFTPDAEVQE